MLNFRVFALLAGCLVVTPIASGCLPPAPAAVNASVNPDVPEIQHSEAFSAVTSEFQNRDYAAALSGIDQLSKRSDLSLGDRVYLDHQASICRDAMDHTLSHQPITRAPVASAPQPARPVPHLLSDVDCGPRALFFVCRQVNHPASLDALTRIAHTEPGRGTSMAGLVKAADSVGFEAHGVQMDADALHQLKPPALAWVDGDHYIAVTNVKGESAMVYDPNHKGEEEIPLTDLLRRSGGVAILLTAKRI